MTSTTPEPTDATGRSAAFAAAVSERKLRTDGSSTDRVARILGIVLMVVGIVATVLAWQNSRSLDDPRDIQSNEILAMVGLAITVVGTGLYVVGALAQGAAAVAAPSARGEPGPDGPADRGAQGPVTSTGSERHPLVDELTLEEKAGLVSGGSFWATRAVERLGIGELVLTDGPHGVRMQAGGVDHLGHQRQPARHVLPGGVRHRLVVGPRAAARDGPGPGGGGARAGRGRAARAGGQHQAPPAVRSQLRVLLGGPVPDRQPRGRTSSRASSPGEWARR